MPKYPRQFADSRRLALGRGDTHVEPVQGGIQLHPAVLPAWETLVRAAAKEGFKLSLASGFRGFERQLSIWNNKLRGLRPVLDDNGDPVDLNQLAELQRVKAVMRWSALPGASRHHWGTDMDIYDAGAVAGDYSLQLIPEEYRGSGPFAPLLNWLREYLKLPEAPEFFFPYTRDTGGVKPEPWHLSYAPVARQFQPYWSLAEFGRQLQSTEIECKAVILEHLDELYEGFIKGSIMAGFDC